MSMPVDNIPLSPKERDALVACLLGQDISDMEVVGYIVTAHFHLKDGECEGLILTSGKGTKETATSLVLALHETLDELPDEDEDDGQTEGT